MANEIDFVEKYYPNYSSSDEIARWNDLQKLIDQEYQVGDGAYRLLVEEFGGDYKQALPMILLTHLEVTEQVYEQSILGYVVENGGV